MKTRILAALVVCLALASCERVKKAIEKVKGTDTEETSGGALADEEKAVPMDPELAKLIDQNEEGILFRRDLPFPKDLTVAVLDKEPLAGQVFQQSEMGKHNTKVSAVRRMSMNIQRTPDSLRFSNQKQEAFDGNQVSGKAAPAPIKGSPLLPPVTPNDHVMVLRNGKWVAGADSFAAAALAQQLGPKIPVLMQEYGLSPRSMWFGKRRIAPGKPMEISGELLPMLLAGNATGALTITLEEIESVHGHPCGRFAIKGSYQRKDFPLTDGRLMDEECTIQSGQIWLSVLHPLVLKYKFERIVTLAVGEGSGPAMRMQGSSSPMRSIDWKAGQ